MSVGSYDRRNAASSLQTQGRPVCGSLVAPRRVVDPTRSFRHAEEVAIAGGPSVTREAPLGDKPVRASYAQEITRPDNIRGRGTSDVALLEADCGGL